MKQSWFKNYLCIKRRGVFPYHPISPVFVIIFNELQIAMK